MSSRQYFTTLNHNLEMWTFLNVVINYGTEKRESVSPITINDTENV